MDIENRGGYLLHSLIFCHSRNMFDGKNKIPYWPEWPGEPPDAVVICQKLRRGDRSYSEVSETAVRPCWKMNSFLSEVLVCWSCTEKITIKIERAFSVILQASSVTSSSFQQSPQLPTVGAASNSCCNTSSPLWKKHSLQTNMFLYF